MAPPVHVLSVRVTALSPINLPQLSIGGTEMNKIHPAITCTGTEEGDLLIAATTEAALAAALATLKEKAGADFSVTAPVVSYRETITAPSAPGIVTRSANKLNLLYIQARPMEKGLAETIENGSIDRNDDKGLTMRLIDTFGWEPVLARKVWAFGPYAVGPNLIVDKTEGVKNLDQDVRNSIENAFQWVGKEGVIAEGTLRGIVFEVCNATLSDLPTKRTGYQIIPTARRAIKAAQLTAQPRLMEPVYLVEIVCPEAAVSAVQDLVTKKRGKVLESAQGKIKAHLPVAESLGFGAALSSASGAASSFTCVFDHWELIVEDPMVAGTRANTLAMQMRTQKGVSCEFPLLNDLQDRL